MRFVEHAAKRPHQCFVFPHLGSQHHEGYLDPGNNLTCIDPHPYLSIVAVREACKLLGWPTPEQHKALQEQTADLATRVVELEDEVTEAQRELDAVYVLRSKNWTPARKQGRPKKEVA